MQDNGDVVPHFLRTYSTEKSTDGGVFDEIKMLLGEVKEIIYPDDKRSRSKKNIEYVVYAQKISNGMVVTQEYRCVISNMFGGLADQAIYTLRVDESDNKTKEVAGNGSKVLFFCINGQKQRGIIIGGVRDPADEKKPAKDFGHHLYWAFNGITAFINKDGEFELQYRGKTKVDGKTDDNVKDEAKTTVIQLRKNGDVRIATKDAKQLVHLDAENGKVIIQRDKNLEIGEATDEMLLGKSFRDAQKQKNNKLKAQFKLLKNMLQQAGIQLNTAGGAIAGPFLAASAGANLIAASQLLSQAATAAEQCGQAIDDFEQAAGQKNGFLSKKNKSD